jgi:hypothetical protein
MFFCVSYAFSLAEYATQFCLLDTSVFFTVVGPKLHHSYLFGALMPNTGLLSVRDVFNQRSRPPFGSPDTLHHDILSSSLSLFIDGSYNDDQL